MKEKKLALITGGTSGIGLGVAKALAGNCDLALAYAGNHERARAAAAALEGSGSRVEVFARKLGGYQDAKSLYEEVVASFGKDPELLVNSAGGIRDGIFMSTDFSHHEQLINEHLLTTMALCHLAVKPMYRKHYGRIVNFSSITGFYAKRGQVNYAAAKAGIIGFTKTLALEVARRGITVNVVAPGLIRTPMTSAITDQLEEAGAKATARHIPVGFIGEPEDVGALVAFLCSDEARYITGAMIPVDGGRSLGDTGH